MLRRVSAHRLDHIAALAVAALVLLVVMCSSNLMSVEKAGIGHVADLFSGPEELARQNMAPLALVVLFVTVLAPLGRLVATLYVLIRAHEQRPPRHLRRVFALAERLRPWSMLEVFVLGVFVAYVKLGDLVEIGLRTGVYALFALTIVLVWLDSAFDREKVWERLDHEDRPDGLPCAARSLHWPAPSAARPAASSAGLRHSIRAARAATAACMHAARTASSAPGHW